MTVRRDGQNDNSGNPLSDWKLVVALALMAVVILATLWMTGSVMAAVVVTIPFLIALGVEVKRLLRIWKG
jgi:hypothetical protein